MLIYNITFHVDGELNLAPYLTYMHDVLYPTAANKEYVKNPRFTRLLTDIGEEMYGFSFSFEVDDVKAMKKWKQEIGNKAEEDFNDALGGKVITFSTTMFDMTTHITSNNESSYSDQLLNDDLIELTAMD